MQNEIAPTNPQNPIPAELRERDQWMCWRYAPDKKGGKKKKVPIDPKTGKRADFTDPSTWASYEDAAAFARTRNVSGIGFVFSPDDPYLGVDLDDCVDPDSGQLSLGVEEVLDSLGSYAEVSPSRAGIKVFVRAAKPGVGCSTWDTPWGGKIEIYDRRRFFAVTGNVYHDLPIADAQEAVDGLYSGLFEQHEARRERRGAARPSGGSSGDVEALLEKARNHPKTGALFRKLHDDGDTSGYPSRSEADQALCGMLAFWFGCDEERMKEVFKQSALAGEGGKYEEKGPHGEKYLEKMVRKAVDSCARTYDPDYGEEMKERVKEIVSSHRLALRSSGWADGEQSVMGYVLHVAEKLGRLEDGGIVFNVNQYEVAEVIGISQRGVSKIIKRLIERGALVRTFRGRKGKNSGYRLRRAEANGSPTYVESSPTYAHRVAPL